MEARKDRRKQGSKKVRKDGWVQVSKKARRKARQLGRKEGSKDGRKKERMQVSKKARKEERKEGWMGASE